LEKSNLELVTELRHELHRHPEVSNHETWTKQHLIEFLKKHTKLEIVDRGLWFYAVYRVGEGRRNIAFRADFDAIRMDETIDIPWASKFPGVAHKCGHDGHAATLAGFALEVDQKGSDNNIFFLFQHAEETGEGAALAQAFIKENGIDEIFAYHNWSGAPLGSVSVIDGVCNWASKGMTIRMEGIPCHASQPENGRNPAFAIAKVIDAIPGLVASHNGRALCTVIQVAVGERAFGVSASKGELLLTIRSLHEADMERLQKDLQRVAPPPPREHGLELSFSFNDVFPETVNHKESSDKIRRVCREKGFRLLEMQEAHRGSEDYGYYTKQIPGALCYIGNGEDYPPVHTHDYDFPDAIIETVVELFKGLAEVEP